MSTMYLGIDVGGTNTKLCVVDPELRILKAETLSTDKSVNIVDFLGSIVDRYRQEFPNIAYVGLGLPGTVDSQSGTVHTAPSILVGERNIKQELSLKIGIPVSVENDVACWAKAEGEIGVCRGILDYVFITIGTGVGSCIVINGKIYKGADLAAGEIGYMVCMEDLEQEVRSTDEFGAFESRVSALAIGRDYAAVTGRRIPTAEMFAQFQDPENTSAQKFISRKMDHLAVGIANIITILHPGKVVMAGGITAQWDFLSQQINTRLSRLIQSRVPLQKSVTGEYGGALGAVIHVLKEHEGS